MQLNGIFVIAEIGGEAGKRIREINENCLKLQAFSDARPEVQPDADK